MSAVSGVAELYDVQQLLRCTLQEHTTGDHYALVMDRGTRNTAVWTSWTRGHEPSAVLTLHDCDATGPAPGYQPCCEFAEHPGTHTFNLNDPFAPSPDAR